MPGCTCPGFRGGIGAGAGGRFGAGAGGRFGAGAGGRFGAARRPVPASISPGGAGAAWRGKSGTARRPVPASISPVPGRDLLPVPASTSGPGRDKISSAACRPGFGRAASGFGRIASGCLGATCGCNLPVGSSSHTKKLPPDLIPGKLLKVFPLGTCLLVFGLNILRASNMELVRGAGVVGDGVVGDGVVGDGVVGDCAGAGKLSLSRLPNRVLF